MNVLFCAIQIYATHAVFEKNTEITHKHVRMNVAPTIFARSMSRIVLIRKNFDQDACAVCPCRSIL